MIEQLFTGIYTRYTDASAESVLLRAALTNSLHLNDAPPNTDFPYGIYFLVSDVPWDKFVERGEEILIQFNLFTRKGQDVADAQTQICQLYDLLNPVYDECTLSVDDYTHVFIKKDFMEMLPPDNDGIYQCSIQYRILIEAD